MHDDERPFLEGLEAGAAGYLLKRAADTDLIGAVRTVGRRADLPLRRRVADAHGRVARERQPRARRPADPARLEVVKLIAEAFTNRQINVLAKLGMRDRLELVRYAIRRGLVAP